MKKILICIILSGWITGTLTAMDIVPYYNYQFSQGASVSPEGDLGFLLNLSNDIGTIVKPLDNHSFIGYYSLNYQGPGLKVQEGREFRERYLNHNFVTRHHWNIYEDMTLKSQLSILMERRRSGTNETWDSGLYNFNRYGGMTSLDKNIFGIDSTISLGYHFITFPNYTDMLAEIRGGADASGTTGTQNHHSLRLSYSGVIADNQLKITVNPLFYTRQNVAVDKVQKDGTYYADKLQKEIILNISGSRNFRISNAAFISPELDFTGRFSNQNYQHFTDATSTTPVEGLFQENFFNYIEPAISGPLSIRAGETWTYFFSPTLRYRLYTSRKPRNKDGDFIDGKKQNRFLGVYSTGFRKQTGESSSTTLFFTYQHQVSNMKFERYIPYNYSGFSFGLRFNMEY